MKKKQETLAQAELLTRYAEKKSSIQRRLEDFSKVSSSEFFYELVYCLLTPQSSAGNASKAVELLKLHDFFSRSIDPTPLLRRRESYIRFHHTKGNNLVSIKHQFPLIAQHLLNGSPGRELRDWLVKNVRGMGYKEASHFLRNIGHRGLAILDRHILKNLVRYGVLRSLPKSLTRKRYFTIEEKLARFSERLGIPMDELDLLFWSMETGVILK